MSCQCALREADARDVAKIVAVMNRAFDPAHGEAWTAAQCLSALAMPGTFALLAEADNRALGFAIARRVLDEAELLLIAVRPDAQGNGIGGAVLRKVIERLARDGGKRLHLETRKENSAIDFYSRRNFAAVGTRPGYYKRADGSVSDAVTLSREI